MNLEKAIHYMEEGVKHYKLIVANNKLINECKNLTSDNINKIDISKCLVELLKDKTEEEREFESWDFLKTYLDSLNENILVLYDVDYMFSPELGNFDVINNFKYYSRNDKTIILFLDAKLLNGYLIYSNEGCGDYRKMDTSEITMVGWDDED